MSASAIKLPSNAQIRRLHDEVEALVRDTVAPTLADVVARAADASLFAGKNARMQADRVSGGIRVHPLISVAIAAAVAFGLGRLTR
jgi:ElaB/YqjD/DUF883 family membrane-anchored ribosome-binding protein